MWIDIALNDFCRNTCHNRVCRDIFQYYSARSNYTVVADSYGAEYFGACAYINIFSNDRYVIMFATSANGDTLSDYGISTDNSSCMYHDGNTSISEFYPPPPSLLHNLLVMRS